MTQNRRIALNVIATYGRSLYAFACGIFTGRWALMALGESDYGLYGVIGGLTAFVAFINSIMSSAVCRFFSVGVGEAKKEGTEGLEHIRRWFNVALAVHTVLPCILISIGYPAGVWCIEHFLTIPDGRIVASIWVWRWTCCACFISMCSVPFQSMYTAKQEIAEMTIYGVLTTTLNIAVLYYMVMHPGYWLTWYAFFMCLVSILPNLLLSGRAFFAFKECRIVFPYMWDYSRLRALVAYAGARSIYLFAQIFSGEGMAVVVNKFLGVTRNATFTVGNSVSSNTMRLAESFCGALYPAIFNAVGEGKADYAKRLTYRSCSLALLSFLIFVLPLTVELDAVLKLWLVTPPARVGVFCIFLFASGFLDRATEGHWMLILAKGDIKRYNIGEAVACFFTVIAAGAFLMTGLDIEAVGIGIFIGKLISAGVKVYYGYKLCGLEMIKWLKEVLMPFGVASVCTLLIGYMVVSLMPSSLIRIAATSLVAELVFLPMVWIFALGPDERDFLLSKVRRVFRPKK